MESGGMYKTSVGSGMLGLEMSLHPHIPQQNSHQMAQQQHSMAPQGYQQIGVQQSKNRTLTLSDDDEHSVEESKRINASPWHRMKWDDNMVRLLIMVVYYIGDDGGGNGNGGGSEGTDQSGKKKGVGILQKKGKWKSVSKAMLERGFYVSPQQCEDKFNDLNKRYKRVNDILGKGTACKVVENQALLESMDHLSGKMKEEVKKLLNSKHLFFREMCAYHNSCNHSGGGGAGGGCAQLSPEVVATEPSQAHHPSVGSKVAKGTSSEEDNEEEEDDEDEEEDEFVVNQEDENDSRKRQRKVNSPLIQQLSSDLVNVVQDSTRSSFEKRVWMKTKMVQLEKERVGYQSQAFELEKQRFKWQRFSSKKEREMERERLSNERLRLENERMLLLIRRKEFEMLGHH